jgi:hypothetical protein
MAQQKGKAAPVLLLGAVAAAVAGVVLLIRRKRPVAKLTPIGEPTIT